MKIIALDSATEACSCALWIDGEVRERFALGTQHSQRILPMLDELLAEAGISLQDCHAIGVTQGPGSFTGVRLGVSLAQGLAFGTGLPLVPVSTLAALAQGSDAVRVCAALDARMRQVYCGFFVRGDDGEMRPVGAEHVCLPAALPLPLVPHAGGWTGTGSGWDHYGDALVSALGSQLANRIAAAHPHAADVSRLAAARFAAGGAMAPEQLQPVYLRDDVARIVS